jgi:hypothetical protein
LNACQIRPFYDNQNDFFFVVEGVVDGSYLWIYRWRLLKMMPQPK